LSVHDEFRTQWELRLARSNIEELLRVDNPHGLQAVSKDQRISAAKVESYFLGKYGENFELGSA
jgi:hypothetical protein